MARSLRVDIADQCYHVINRASARLSIFQRTEEFGLFESVLVEAKEKLDMRILAYCCMPNHFHLVLQPRHDGDLSKFLYWFTLTLTARWHAIHGTTGYGHIFQGRYKSFLIQNDRHLLTVIRYVERNPLRASLIQNLSEWRCGSYYRRMHGSLKQRELLSPPSIPLPNDYVQWVQKALSDSEVQSIRESVNRSKPFGADNWRDVMVSRFNLQASIRNKGRPLKGS